VIGDIYSTADVAVVVVVVVCALAKFGAADVTVVILVVVCAGGQFLAADVAVVVVVVVCALAKFGAADVAIVILVVVYAVAELIAADVAVVVLVVVCALAQFGTADVAVVVVVVVCVVTGCGDLAVAGLPSIEIGDRSLCLIIGIELFAGALVISFVTVSAAGSGLTGLKRYSTLMAVDIFAADVALVVVILKVRTRAEIAGVITAGAVMLAVNDFLDIVSFGSKYRVVGNICCCCGEGIKNGAVLGGSPTGKGVVSVCVGSLGRSGCSGIYGNGVVLTFTDFRFTVYNPSNLVIGNKTSICFAMPCVTFSAVEEYITLCCNLGFGKRLCGITISKLCGGNRNSILVATAGKLIDSTIRGSIG